MWSSTGSIIRKHIPVKMEMSKIGKIDKLDIDGKDTGKEKKQRKLDEIKLAEIMKKIEIVRNHIRDGRLTEAMQQIQNNLNRATVL